MRPLLFISAVSIITLCLCSYVYGQQMIHQLSKPDKNAEYSQWYDYYKQQYELYGSNAMPPSKDDPEVAQQEYMEVKQDINDVGLNKPPLLPERIFGEIVIGGGVGFAGLLGGFIIVDSMDLLPWYELELPLFMSSFSSSICVYLIGNRGNETGS